MQKQHDEKLSKIQELKGTKEALMNELEKKKNENPEKMKEFNELSEEYNSRRDQFMALLADKPHENNKKVEETKHLVGDDPEALVEAIQVGWTRPKLDWFKLNVDASIQKDHMHQHALAAIGGLVRDMHGGWHGGFAGTVPNSSILATELESILQGV
ncbi:hypothetical protein BUALT_Bualt02G0180800 [Buddleja alternifolia]|uniref:Uncharacterized protein n=1 Tax=Buddleja alternifolia TaxID=168488 RepID=A0AAV6Y965_9LAMI|nr:hypothetical protein BUALT_Bualt02G0180800 [Buddleja alternifolia]